MSLKNNYHIAVPTAFREDESLNVESTFEHIRFLYSQGVKSVLLCGSTGEQHSLNLDEKIELIEQLPKLELNKDFELIFGISSIRQKEAEILSKVASHSKYIDALLIGFPPYILPTQEEAILYASKLITLSQKPTIIYNNPLRTGFNLEADSYISLLEDKCIIGIKEAGDPNIIPEIVAHTNRHLLIYAGGEKNLQHKIELGFNSLSSIAGNLYPKEIQKWFNYLLGEGFPQNYETLNSKIEALYSTNILPYIKKEITNKEDINFGICRSPVGSH